VGVNVNDQWTPGEPLVLVRNERYWANPVPLERVVFRAINDELPRLTAYKNGEGDMITPSAPQFVTSNKDAQWVATNQNLNWVNMKSGNSFIAWNCGERNGKLTPFHDRRVRLAMTHLLDREKMIRDVWAGIGMISKGSALPISPASNPNTKPWPFDLARAKQLLKEAGWEDRNNNGVIEDASGNEFVFEFTYSTGGEIAQRIALFIQDSCRGAGIRVTLRGVDWSVSDPIRKQRDFDAITMGWGANAPESDPKQIYHSASIKDQGDNFAQWNNPEADRLIDAGRRELDFEKRQKIWHEFEEVMHNDQPYTWIRVAPFVRFVKPEIGNVNTYPKGLEPWEFFRGSGPLTSSPSALR
jgi:peptide/nickel transport system substrate-binding protein